jgi:hypothetical protein
MANKYPYVASAGPLVKAVAHLRRSFPKEVTADTLRKLGVAPKNESYVINVLRFLGVIDDEGKKVDAKAKAFVHHGDAFAAEFAKLVEESYEELFELHGAESWKLDRDSLTQFFRTTDRSTDVVGTRQAGTFAALAALSGHSEVPTPKVSSAPPRKNIGTARTPRKDKTDPGASVETERGKNGSSAPAPQKGGGVGLTVRIEVNLPANGDQETYDKIFRSIRQNLIDGKLV